MGFTPVHTCKQTVKELFMLSYRYVSLHVNKPHFYVHSSMLLNSKKKKKMKGKPFDWIDFINGINFKTIYSYNHSYIHS